MMLEKEGMDVELFETEDFEADVGSLAWGRELDDFHLRVGSLLLFGSCSRHCLRICGFFGEVARRLKVSSSWRCGRIRLAA
jgi:hypothetical protein